jgi:uncharacterized protein YbaP (TraB family)
VSILSRLAVRACAFLVGALALSLAHAEPPKPCQGSDLTEVKGLAAAVAARADDLVNGDGLLWRIEKPGLAPSYLFGTIHSTDDSALEVAHRAAQSIKDAKIVATELGGPIDTIEKANITAATLSKALDRDHDTFEGSIAPEDRKTVEKLITGLGYPAEFAHHLKPWFLAILTGLPKCEAERETLNLPEVDQFLAETASLNDNLYATMLRLYRESRPAEILAVSDALGGLSDSERAAQDEFMLALLQGRNATMAERAAPLLASGGAFIAVGALHLAGKTGLIEQFRALGYTITKVW